MDGQQHDRKEARTGNSGFAKKRVKWLIEHTTSHQLLSYVDSFVLRNPLLRKAAKRWTEDNLPAQPGRWPEWAMLKAPEVGKFLYEQVSFPKLCVSTHRIDEDYQEN